MSRSQKAAHYGAEVEKQMAEQYGLDLDRSSWRDGWMDREPVEIKAAMHRRANGYPGRFRVFGEPHRELAKRDGWYVFAVYRVRGRGVSIIEDRALRARSLRFDWGPSNHGSPNRERQKKIRIDRVMG